MITHWTRGHEVSIEDMEDKCCKRCGRPPTPEGYDACLGYIPGAKAACCGHGEYPSFVIYEDDNND